MKNEEIQQLLELWGWSKADLADAVDLTEIDISKWFAAGHAPKGPPSILLGEWLERAKAGQDPPSKWWLEWAKAGEDPPSNW